MPSRMMPDMMLFRVIYPASFAEIQKDCASQTLNKKIAHPQTLNKKIAHPQTLNKKIAHPKP